MVRGKIFKTQRVILNVNKGRPLTSENKKLNKELGNQMTRTVLVLLYDIWGYIYVRDRQTCKKKDMGEMKKDKTRT